MNAIISNVKISGIACAVPDHVVKTSDYENVFGKETVDKYIESVGINERHLRSIGKNVTTSDLCFAAAEKLLHEMQIDKNVIDGLIFVSQYPDYPVNPATACVLQHRLELSENCMAYDINQGCTGYLYGLYNAASHLQSGYLKKILLLVGDAGHRVSPEDKSMAMMFGDAGSATLLEYDVNAEKMEVSLKTLGSGYRTIITPYGGARHPVGNEERKLMLDGVIRSDFNGMMDGVGVFNFTIKEIPKLLKEFFSYFKTDLNMYNMFFLHQANLYMIKYLAKKCKMDLSKIPISIDRYGNTSSASIPLTICDYYTNSGNHEIDKCMLMGFGVGLSLGIVTSNLSNCYILPIVFSEEGYNDGYLDN